MYSKIKLTGKIKLRTGLYIGGGSETSMIGAVDSYVVRDSVTRMPIIPGSSIKGKMRTLLARYYSTEVGSLPDVKNDVDEVKRLFGASLPEVIPSRLQISDAFYSKESKKEFDDKSLNYTEIKFENTINRLTGVANPRQIERVVRGSSFDFEMIYNVDNEAEVERDFEVIGQALALLENDYLGGGGTRGNGRVAFDIESIETVVGEYDSSKLEIVK